MDEILRLYKELDFEAVVKYGISIIASCKAEEKYRFLGAIGRAYYELGQFVASANTLDEAIALNPGYAVGLRNRGLAYFQQEKYENVVADFEKSIAISSSDFAAYDVLGLSYAELGQHHNAIVAYSTYLDYVFDVDVLAWRADSYAALGSCQKALVDWGTVFRNELADEAEVKRITMINSPRQELALGLPENVITESIEAILMAMKFSVISHISAKNTLLATCGIYVLEFFDGEYYVGQSVNPVARIQAHNRKYNDLKKVYFKSLSGNDLLTEENKIISVFEKKLIRIRNLKQINFSNLFDYSKQQTWIIDNKFNWIAGARFKNEIVRAKFHEKFLILKKEKYFSNLTNFISKYIKQTIPKYIASEYNYWSISCLPDYLKSEGVVMRININSVPVISIFMDDRKPGSLQAMLYLSKLPFYSHIRNGGNFEQVFSTFADLRFGFRNAFETARGDEVTAFVKQEDFANVLENSLLLSAIRLFNLRMMNDVGKEEGFRRTVHHCIDLADVLI